MNQIDWHRKLAHYSIGASILSLLLLVVTLPSLFYKAETEMQIAMLRANQFKEKTNEIWEHMVVIQPSEQNPVKALLFSRRKRDPFEAGFCKGCFQLACPQGLAGPPGSPGTDGRPGESGNQGRAGEDGFDVQLESEPEMPCVVCPSGPPGTRGAQGERGRQGESGTKGEHGPDGNPGMDGPLGHEGSPGRMGPKGPEGPKGNEGKTAVAGIGIKGPKGPPGPMGMKGPPGPTGRNSILPGEAGTPGEPGPIGPPGNIGSTGNEGPYGPPGEPGMPAAYCPSDCGVQQILANVMPDRMSEIRSHVHTSGSSYVDSEGQPKSGYMLRDDPTFRVKLARKMLRRKQRLQRMRNLKIRRL